METRAHHVLIGLFTVIVVAGALLFGLWLAKSSVDTEFKDYEIVFSEAVSGLSKGSSVQYSGIKVGDVVSLRLDPQDPRRVLARIRLGGDTPVKEDTQAKLALAGITGTSIIQLSGGTPESPKLRGHDGNLPTIVAAPSPISRLLNDSSDLMSGISTLLHNANQIFSAENVTRISGTLANLEQTTGAINDQRGDLRQAMQQLASVGKQAGSMLEQTSLLMRNANGLLNDQGKQALGSAEQAMKSLEQSSATINALLSKNQNSLDSGMQGLTAWHRQCANCAKPSVRCAPSRNALRPTPAATCWAVTRTRSSRHEVDSTCLSLPVSRCWVRARSCPSRSHRTSIVFRAAQAPASASSAMAQHWSLRLNKLQASEALNRSNIAVIPQGDVISSYKASRWSDPAPVLMRNRLLDGFQRDGRVTLLSTDDSNFQADLELGGSLQAFQTEYQGTQASVVVRVDALLIRGYDQRILASRRFEERQPLNDVKVPAVVAGFGQASDRLTAKVVAWAVDQGQKLAPQPRP
jgi:phospholipid/cholesterol/gamma-HCH transport system substrate-binding protein